MEPFRDSIIFREPPHTGDLRAPVIQGLGQCFHGREAAVTQFPDPIDQSLDQGLAGLLRSVLNVEQRAERFLGLVEDPNGRMGIEVAIQPKLLVRTQFGRVAAHKRE